MEYISCLTGLLSKLQLASSTSQFNHPPSATALCAKHITAYCIEHKLISSAWSASVLQWKETRFSEQHIELNWKLFPRKSTAKTSGTNSRSFCLNSEESKRLPLIPFPVAKVFLNRCVLNRGRGYSDPWNPSSQFTGLKGSAASIMVPDTTGDLQRSFGEHALVGQSCFSDTKGTCTLLGGRF